MSFLEKIGLKHKDKSGSDIPPPPPMPGKGKDQAEQKESDEPTEKKDFDLPPLPKQDKQPSEDSTIRDLPSRSAKQQDKQPSDEHPNRKPLPTSPKKAPDKKESAQQVPDKEPAPQQPPQAPPAPTQPQKKQEKFSRQDLRKAFDDVPPIKASQKGANTKITDEDVKNFEVDDMVLPGEEEDEPEPQPRRIPDEQPLFVNVSTYEEIQKRMRDLKRQIKAAGTQVDGILKEREQEDKEFSEFVKQIEEIQDDLITIDEDLFEKK